MHAAGVKRLRASEQVLAADFARSCPDQKTWLERLGVSRRGTRNPTLAQSLAIVAYTGRPEYFTMYACVYGAIRASKEWLERHEGQLCDAKAAFLEKHGFQSSPAHVVAIVRHDNAQV